jgi:KEOPS complex subunit Pcc1
MTQVAMFKFECENAHFLFRILKPELGDELGSRAVVDATVEGDRTLTLKITAEDTSSLRATLNMWLRIINIAYEMEELVEHGSNPNESSEPTRNVATTTAATSDGRRSKDTV